MAKTMWQFKTKHFTVRWAIERDVLDTAYMDADVANECHQKVRNGEWKCFASTIEVIENSSKIAIGEAFLGGSIYENPADFRDHFGMNLKGHGSYFSQMVREAIAEARENFHAAQARAKKEIAEREALLKIHLKSRKTEQNLINQ